MDVSRNCFDCRFACPAPENILFYLFMVYLIGTDTVYIDKLEKSYPMQVAQFIENANLQHPSLERLL